MSSRTTSDTRTRVPAHEPVQQECASFSSPQPAASGPGQSRRSFLGRLGALAAGSAVGALSSAPIAAAPKPVVVAPGFLRGASAVARRRDKAVRLRAKSAEALARSNTVLPAPGVDEKIYPNRIGSYSKGLPHDDSGLVDPAAFDALRKATKSGVHGDFEAIPKGGAAPQGNPQAAYSFGMEGADAWALTTRTPPPIASAETAGEMAELYWHALTRDVLFADFDSDPVIARACADLTEMSDYRAPRQNGVVTPATLFRGGLPGDLDGPLVSQFLFKNVQHGALAMVQAQYLPSAGQDFAGDMPSWLAMQRGAPVAATVAMDPNPRFIRCQRDLAEWVHRDWPAQLFVCAALIMQGFGPSFRSSALPYAPGGNQSGFVTFGVGELMAILNEVAVQSLRAAWYFKWCGTRRVRPEALAGAVHRAVESGTGEPFHADLLESDALTEIFARNANYLLPQCYPEGSPMFPAYPSGHATIAGACCTVLKAFFNEAAPIPDPVVPTAHGSTLESWIGTPLTLGGEINKLASNVSIGRNMAGVHYRSDAMGGILLGEQLALALLAERRHCYNEPFGGFHLTRFDGTAVVV